MAALSTHIFTNCPSQLTWWRCTWHRTRSTLIDDSTWQQAQWNIDWSDIVFFCPINDDYVFYMRNLPSWRPSNCHCKIHFGQLDKVWQNFQNCIWSTFILEMFDRSSHINCFFFRLEELTMIWDLGLTTMI